MTPLTIALDMDGTVYDLQTGWLKWLKDVHSETLRPEDIETWDFHDQVECGTQLYDYLHIEGVFTNAPLIAGAQEAINQAHDMGVRQFFVSTIKSKFGAYEKQQAIERDFPHLKDDVIITSHNKDMLRADMLVDDGPHNLEAFAPYGRTCKVPYRYNAHVSTDYTMFSWHQYPKIIERIIDDLYEL